MGTGQRVVPEMPVRIFIIELWTQAFYFQLLQRRSVHCSVNLTTVRRVAIEIYKLNQLKMRLAVMSVLTKHRHRQRPELTCLTQGQRGSKCSRGALRFRLEVRKLTRKDRNVLPLRLALSLINYYARMSAVLVLPTAQSGEPPLPPTWHTVFIFATYFYDGDFPFYDQSG